MRHLWLVLVTGCLFDSQKPPVCAQEGAGAIASESLRDPSTGQCTTLGSPGCDPACGQLCPATGALPDWAACGGPCDSLTEAQCLASATCHAAYQDDSAAQPVFWGCWGLPPSGPSTGSCTNLDAQTCSEHPDCTSLYTGPVNQPPSFVPSYESCHPKVMPPACSTLTTEAACKARSDCDAVYTGMNCTCDNNGCTCATETFSHCQ
jgi:hypothetical protein